MNYFYSLLKIRHLSLKLECAIQQPYQT